MIPFILKKALRLFLTQKKIDKFVDSIPYNPKMIRRGLGATAASLSCLAVGTYCYQRLDVLPVFANPFIKDFLRSDDYQKLSNSLQTGRRLERRPLDHNLVLEVLTKALSNFKASYKEEYFRTQSELADLTENEKKFYKCFSNWKKKEKALFRDLVKTVLVDAGYPLVRLDPVLNQFEQSEDFQILKNKLLLETYSDHFEPLNCPRREFRESQKFVEYSMSYGKEKKFQFIKDEEERVQVLLEFYRQKSQKFNAMDLAICVAYFQDRQLEKSFRREKRLQEKLKIDEMEILGEDGVEEGIIKLDESTEKEELQEKKEEEELGVDLDQQLVNTQMEEYLEAQRFDREFLGGVEDVDFLKQAENNSVMENMDWEDVDEKKRGYEYNKVFKR